MCVRMVDGGHAKRCTHKATCNHRRRVVIQRGYGAWPRRQAKQPQVPNASHTGGQCTHHAAHTQCIAYTRRSVATARFPSLKGGEGGGPRDERSAPTFGAGVFGTMCGGGRFHGERCVGGVLGGVVGGEVWGVCAVSRGVMCVCVCVSGEVGGESCGAFCRGLL